MLRDFSAFGYPLAHFHRAAFWNGELPLWNSLSFAGIPWLAQWNTLSLYPGALLYLIPPLPWSLNFYCVAHLYLAGIGMYFLARRWTGDQIAAVFAACGYALSGLSQNCLMWPNNIAALAWLPFVLLTLRPALQSGGRALLTAIIVGSLQMLTGAPEIILLTWLGAGGLALVHLVENRDQSIRGLFRFGAVVIAISLVCAAQLLPFLELLRLSSRADTGGENTWALGELGWINLFMPLFESRSKGTGAIFHANQAWSHSIYLGLPILWLATCGLISLSGMRRWLCVAGLVVSLVLSVGFSALSIDAVPILSLVRYPVKFIVVWLVVLPLLAGLGLRHLRERGLSAGKFAAAGVGLLAIIAVACVGAGRPDNLPSEMVLRNFVWRLIAAGIVIGLLLRGIDRDVPDGFRCVLAALGVLILDLFVHQVNLYPSIDSRWFTDTNPVMENFAEPVRAGLARVHPVRSRQMQNTFNVDASLQEAFILSRVSMASNWNLVEGIAKVNGFYSLWLRPQGETARALFHDSEGIPSGLADFLGIRHLSATENNFEWPIRETALALVQIGMKPAFAEPETIRDIVYTEKFDPRETVWLPLQFRTELQDVAKSTARVEDIALANEKISFRSRSSTDAIATLAVSYHPGWGAYSDGVPIPIYPANHGYMAVRVPAGEHSIRLVYREVGFETGRWISLTALLALAAAWWMSRNQAVPPKET